MSSQVPVDPAADLTTMQFHQHEQMVSTARINKDFKDRVLELCKTCKTPNQIVHHINEDGTWGLAGQRLKQQILGIRKRWLASMELPLHQRNTMAELQLLLDEYQLDFENPEEIRGQDLHEPFIIPVTIDAETQTLDLLIMTKAGALKMVTAADTFGIVVHCDTTFNIFNSEQIAGGFGITDARHKLHPTAVFITKPKGLDTDKYKNIMRKIMDVTAAIVRAELNIELQEDKYVWSMSDFDKALTNAMKETFDDRHGGCEFHLLKAVKPKLALLSDKDRAGEVKGWIRFLMRSTTEEQLDYFKTVFDNCLEDERRFQK